MSFKSADFSGLAKFNSANSCDFLEMYESALDKRIAESDSKPKNPTIAPSAMYCLKQNWFRLRGVLPDKPGKPDKTLDFTASVGTACHEKIQNILKEELGDDWLDVGCYIKDTLRLDWGVSTYGFETRIEVKSPPIRFSCDGLIRWKGNLYLIEIKTAEFNSWNKLTTPRPIHVNQVKSYCTLLNVNNVLMIYQDRQYGGMKVFEFHISDDVIKQTWDTFYYLVDMAEKNLPPEGLPTGDSRCSSSMCPFYKKCKQW